MMRIFRKLHLWLSIPFGLIITLICFSGAMLVFESEITRALRHDVYYVAEVGEAPMDMESLMENVKAMLPDSVSITGVTVYPEPDRTYQVNLSKPRRASLFVDQYCGRITGRNERLGFFSVMFSLHRWLLDSSDPHGDGLKTGKLIVGISTLMFVIILLTGIVMCLPRARKGLRRSMSISLSGGWRGFWKGLHIAGGMYAVVFVLAMALTGLTWSFGWYRSAFYAVCGVEQVSRDSAPSGRNAVHSAENTGRHHSAERHHGGSHERERDRHDREYACWQQIWDEINEKYPDGRVITIGPGRVSVSLGDNGNVRAADNYEFDRYSGEITKAVMYSEASGTDRLRGWIFSIHTGGLGGVFTRVLWLLGALLGASLPLTGYYIWIKHLKKRKNMM